MKNKQSEIEALLLPSEVCNILNCSLRTLYRIRREEKIVSHKIRGRIMFKKEDVQKYIESCKEAA